MLLYFVRHGATAANENGVWQGAELNTQLSELGVAQARGVAEALKQYPIERIFSSDLLRAAQTASILQNALSVPVEHDPLLREVKLGIWSGMLKEDVYAGFPELLPMETKLINAAPPGGETQIEVVARSRQAIARILACGFEHVAVVTHGAFLRATLCDMLCIPLDRRKALPHANCGMTIIDANHGFFYVRTMNRTFDPIR